MTAVQPVILAGGTGTRLWPLSREWTPKQFHSLDGGKALFTRTLERLDRIRHVAPMVVCNEAHRFVVRELLSEVDVRGAEILLEPIGRNTAPAIAVAALQTCADDRDPVLLVLPADHVLGDEASFTRAAEQAIRAAADGSLVTFGVVPTAPETGYGYIRATAGTGPMPVERFVEKPTRPVAESYLAEGGYYWNSGMFAFRASAVLEALARHAPDILNACLAAHEAASVDGDFIRLEAGAFHSAPSESIDRAVMEHTERAVMVPLDAGWSDIGSWSAAWEHLVTTGATDADGNVTHGEVVTHEAAGTLVHATHRLVGVVGVVDHVIVETADAVLVVPRGRAQEVKDLVERMRREGRPESESHQRVTRPWGGYEVLGRGERFQVKHLVIEPGGQLSLQMHHHRAEHWVVVRGTARVVSGKESFLLTENQSTYIPVGGLHRLENPGIIPLELIEVQSGSYLGEDDIVRFEDCYGRPARAAR